MEWIEADPIPDICRQCQEAECYNCDTAGKRWVLSRKDELLLRRKGLLRSIERLRRQVEQIERELDTLGGDCRP